MASPKKPAQKAAGSKGVKSTKKSVANDLKKGTGLVPMKYKDPYKS